MDAKDRIASIQTILGVTSDGLWGPRSQEALDALIHPVAAQSSSGSTKHVVRASSFADPADVRAFKKCKERGGSDQDCFKVGDNGIGCYGDDVSEGTGPSCALPPEDSEEKWGSVANAKHKLVEVTANGVAVTCVLKDRMPHRANIKNGAGIDLNPDAVRALGLQPPIMIAATWQWVNF
jgi:hypothetical protein